MNTKLVFLDLETGGLNGRIETGELGCHHYPILEIAVIVTDSDLNQIGEPLVIPVFQTDTALSKCHEWALAKHEETGLLKRVRESGIALDQAEDLVIQYLGSVGVDKYDRKTKSGGVLAGSSIHFDRSFIMAQMNELNNYLHYRQLDVSALALTARMFCPEAEKLATQHKELKHEALADIRETITELRFYKENVFNIDFEE